jgi:hypothetical protein
MDDFSHRRGKSGWFSSFAENSRLLIIEAKRLACSVRLGARNEALPLVRVPLLIGDGLCRQNSGFVFRDSENRERAFEYAFSMVGASVSTNDPTNGHQDQAQEDIQCDRVVRKKPAELKHAQLPVLRRVPDLRFRLTLSAVAGLNSDQ